MLTACLHYSPLSTATAVLNTMAVEGDASGHYSWQWLQQGRQAAPCHAVLQAHQGVQHSPGEAACEVLVGALCSVVPALSAASLEDRARVRRTAGGWRLASLCTHLSSCNPARIAMSAVASAVHLVGWRLRLRPPATPTGQTDAAHG